MSETRQKRRKMENKTDRKEEETKFRTTRNLKGDCFFSLSDWDCDNKDGIPLTKCRKLHWVW